MISIAPDALPPPSTFSVKPMTSRRVTASGLVPYAVVPDPALLRRSIVCAWSRRHVGVIDAVRRHHREHRHATFTFRFPRTGELVTVGWRSLSIQWETQVVGSATGELEELPAHE